jgi:hypothetical protein
MHAAPTLGVRPHWFESIGQYGVEHPRESAKICTLTNPAVFRHTEDGQGRRRHLTPVHVVQELQVMKSQDSSSAALPVIYLSQAQIFKALAETHSKVTLNVSEVREHTDRRFW